MSIDETDELLNVTKDQILKELQPRIEELVRLEYAKLQVDIRRMIDEALDARTHHSSSSHYSHSSHSHHNGTHKRKREEDDYLPRYPSSSSLPLLPEEKGLTSLPDKKLRTPPSHMEEIHPYRQENDVKTDEALSSSRQPSSSSQVTPHTPPSSSSRSNSSTAPAPSSRDSSTGYSPSGLDGRDEYSLRSSSHDTYSRSHLDPTYPSEYRDPHSYSSSSYSSSRDDYHSRGASRYEPTYHDDVYDSRYSSRQSSSTSSNVWTPDSRRSHSGTESYPPRSHESFSRAGVVEGTRCRGHVLNLHYMRKIGHVEHPDWPNSGLWFSWTQLLYDGVGIGDEVEYEIGKNNTGYCANRIQLLRSARDDRLPEEDKTTQVTQNPSSTTGPNSTASVQHKW